MTESPCFDTQRLESETGSSPPQPGEHLRHIYAEGAQAFAGQIKPYIDAWQEEHPQEEPVFFHIGEPAGSPSPEALTMLARQAYEEKTHDYQSVEGGRGIREAIAGHSERAGFYPFPVGPENIVVGVSGKGMMNEICLAAVNPGEKVAVFGPGYPGNISAALFASRGNLVRLPVREKNSWTPDPEETASILKREQPRVVILCDPQNPTGGILEPETQQVIRDYIKEGEDRLVVADSVYHEFNFTQGGHAPISSHSDIANQVITIDGASKDLAATGWRIGWVTFPDRLRELRKATIAVQNHFLSCPPTPLTEALIPALDSLNGQTLNYLREEYKGKRDSVVTAFGNIPGLSCAIPKGAFYLMLNVSQTGLTGEEFARLAARQAGITLLPAHHFGTSVLDIHGGSLFPQEEADRYVRVSFVGDCQKMTTGIDRLAKALQAIY